MRAINNLGIMISVATIFSTRIRVPRIKKIPSDLSWYTIRCTGIIIIRCGVRILRRMMSIIANTTSSWQISNRSKYCKRMVANET